MANPSSNPQPTPPRQPAHDPAQKPLDTDPPPGATPRPGGPAARVVLESGARPVPDYELVERLGRGGFGEVWKAKGASNFDVALKFIRLGDKASEVELRSLEFMKGIRHAHLLSMFGAWQRDAYLIVAMELADGTLLDRLNQATAAGQPGIPLAELLEMMREAAKGIDYLTSLGIQHRDIKPQNMLLVGGSVRIADFGLAKVLAQTIGSHSGPCSISYAAPEFFQEQTTNQSDQYSLAISYCQLRGGTLPFQGNQAGVMAGHLFNSPDLTMVPAQERPVVTRALAKKPPERWPTCRAFVDALTAAATGKPAGPSTLPLPPVVPPARTITEPRPKPRPQPKIVPKPSRWLGAGIAVVLGALLLSLILFVAWLATGGSPTTSQKAMAQVPPKAELKDKGEKPPPQIIPAPQPQPAKLELDPIATITLDAAGASQPVPVRVKRQNYNGPIKLDVQNKPPGVLAVFSEILEGVDTAEITLTAPVGTAAADQLVRVSVEAGEVKTTQEFRLIVRPTRPLPHAKSITNSIGMKLVLIPAGKFLMGSPEGEEDREPFDKGSEFQHEVTLTKPFHLGIHEVTQEQYERVMGINPSWFSPQGSGKDKVAGKDTKDFPVESVSWEDAVRFCRKLSDLAEEKQHKRVYRLPTEAEWEYACREGGSSLTPFHFGPSLSSDLANFDGNFPYGGAAKGDYLKRTTTVGSYKPNQFGLFDMHGNVREWCADYYDKDFYKAEEAKVDPENKNPTTKRVVRGGGWGSNGGHTWSCRAAYRTGDVPINPISDVGFRVVLVAGVRTP